ncbi:MAG: hypothetical protein RR620_12955 [Clostridium sp.]
MAKILSETVKSAISLKIKSNYPDVNIYKNKVKQGMKMPCFFISQIDTSQEKVSKTVYKRDYVFNIRYHIDASTRTELDEVGIDLLGILDQLEIDKDMFFGNKLRYEIIDEVLHVFVNYSIRLVKEDEGGIPMETLDIKGGMK